MNLEEAKALCDKLDINDGSQRAEAMLVLHKALSKSESIVRRQGERLRGLEPLANIEFEIGVWTVCIRPLEARIDWYRSSR